MGLIRAGARAFQANGTIFITIQRHETGHILFDLHTHTHIYIHIYSQTIQIRLKS